MAEVRQRIDIDLEPWRMSAQGTSRHPDSMISRGSAAVVRGGSPDVGNWHEGEPERGAKPVRLCPCSSDVNLFSYGEGIVDFDAEIPDGTLDLWMS